MSLALKAEPKGARIRGLRPEILLAAVIADGVWRDVGLDLCVITSGVDGRHSPQSLHYAGAAIDLRTRDLAPQQIEDIARTLRGRLGVDFDVVVESDHLHVEYQPRGS